MPDCITTFAHSLQGNKATYMEQSLTLLEFLFNIALTSAWHTATQLMNALN